MLGVGGEEGEGGREGSVRKMFKWAAMINYSRQRKVFRNIYFESPNSVGDEFQCRWNV